MEVLSRYVTIFIHPIQSQEFFRRRRLEDGPKEEGHLCCLSFIESLAVSWIFVIASSFYSLVSLNISKSALLPSTVSMEKFALLIVMADIVLFPLWMLLYVKYWEVIITLFARIYGQEDKIDGPIKEVIYSSTCANILLLVPMFGWVLRLLVGLFLLAVGLKKNIGLSNLQSALTLLSPLMVLLILFFGMMVGTSLWFSLPQWP